MGGNLQRAPLTHQFLAVLTLISGLYGCRDPIKVRWSYSFETQARSSPKVTPNYLAVGLQDGLAILGLDGTKTCVFNDSGEVVAAPAISGERIGFGSLDHHFYAIDSRCSLLWKYEAGARLKSAVDARSDLFVASDLEGKTIALEADTGKLRWEHRAALASEIAAPRIAGDEVLLALADGTVVILELETGKLLGSIALEASVVGSVQVRGGHLFIATSDGAVLSVARATKTLRWRAALPSPPVAEPTVHGQYLAVISSDRMLHVLDAESGKSRWSRPLKGLPRSSPTLSGDVVVVPEGWGAGGVSAHELESGKGFGKFSTAGDVIGEVPSWRGRHYAISTEGTVYALRVQVAAPDR